MKPEKVIGVAQSWLGLDFKKDRSEQCAAFVRAVFGEAGVPLGVATRPSDWALTGTLEQGPEFANSFAADDVGRLVGLAAAAPGDIVLFRDTYEGDFPAGCITHVGIYSGGGKMIDRSTSSLPVREIELDPWWLERLVEIRRPLAFG